MPAEASGTVTGTPAALRWVLPATIIGALVILGVLLKVQYNRMADGPARLFEASVAVDSEFLEWLERTSPLMASLKRAFDEVGDAAMDGDFVGTGAACRAGLSTTSALVAELPSPDTRLDFPLRQALDEYERALSLCVSGSEHDEAAELASAADWVTRGDRHWRAAVGLMGPEWPGLPSSVSGPGPVFKT